MGPDATPGKGMSTNAPDTTQVSSPLPGIERAGEEAELQALFSESHLQPSTCRESHQ